VLAQRREEFKESWARGDFTYLEQYATAIGNAKAIGACDTYQEVLDVDYAAIIGELSDEHSTGSEPGDDVENDEHEWA
jgi:hypothetical protein